MDTVLYDATGGTIGLKGGMIINRLDQFTKSPAAFP